MALNNRATLWANELKRPQQQNTQGISIPAPTNGVNATGNLFNMAVEDAVFLYNMIPSDTGCRVRKGFSEWANDSGGSQLGDVRTILPFTGEDGTKKLFAVTNAGVYDITASTTTPSLVVDYSVVAGFVTTGDAGWCSYEQFTNDAGGTYLLVADEVNGYFYYDGSSWTTAPSLSSGITDPKTVVHVRVWKNRVWLTKEDSGSAYYLGLGAISGANTLFEFGNKFSHGGYLVGLWTYTRDGGDGIDDFLVAISSGGDLLIYQGYDPANSATFDLRGSWYLGDIPAGRRLASEFGGDLLILSTYGLMALSKILSGEDISDPDFYVTYKIAPLVRTIMQDEKDSNGWEIRVHNREGILVLNTPKHGTNPYVQFVLDINKGGWCVFRGIPMLCSEVWQNNIYFGTTSTGDEGRIYYMTGDTDNVTLAGGNDGKISWGLLTSFNNHGTPGRWKRSQFVRPVFSAERDPPYIAKAKYDFDIEELGGTVPAVLPTSADVWDTALWDTAIWGDSDAQTPYEEIRGGCDMGRHVAYSLKGESNAETVFLGFDVMEDIGGLL